MSSFFVFYSSRIRHTSWPRDWSSDVCYSDLKQIHRSVEIDIEIVAGILLTGGDGHLGSQVIDKISLSDCFLNLIGIEIGRASCRERVLVFDGCDCLDNYRIKYIYRSQNTIHY